MRAVLASVTSSVVHRFRRFAAALQVHSAPPLPAWSLEAPARALPYSISGIRIHASSVFIGILPCYGVRRTIGITARSSHARRWTSYATGNRSLLQTVGTSFDDSNVFLLAAFHTGSPLTLLALRLARLRWPLGFAALVLAYDHPWPTLGCHPGTTA